MFSKMNGVRPSGATTTSVRSPPMKPKLVPAGVSIEYTSHRTQSENSCTDKKEKEIFRIFNEIQMGSGCKVI